MKRSARALRSGQTRGGSWGQTAPGVLLGDWGPVLNRGDMIDIGKAVRRDWPIPAAKRRAFVGLLEATITQPGIPARHTLSAASLMIAMDAANIRAQRRALAEVFPLDGDLP